MSWSRFHDHKDTGLIGNLQDNAAEDAGKLHATYHHNLFLKVNSGPRMRYGTVHFYSNHFQEVTVNGVAAETMSTAIVEQNMFDRVGTPITTDYEDLETRQRQRRQQHVRRQRRELHLGDRQPGRSPISTPPDSAGGSPRSWPRARAPASSSNSARAAGGRSDSRYSTLPLPPVIGETVSAPTS